MAPLFWLAEDARAMRSSVIFFRGRRDATRSCDCIFAEAPRGHASGAKRERVANVARRGFLIFKFVGSL
jgi:hypothetical protein